MTASCWVRVRGSPQAARRPRSAVATVTMPARVSRGSVAGPVTTGLSTVISLPGPGMGRGPPAEHEVAEQPHQEHADHGAGGDDQWSGVSAVWTGQHPRVLAQRVVGGLVEQSHALDE